MTPAQHAAAKAMPEKQLQEAVRKMCADLGLFYFHVLNSKGCEPGWPDCTIAGRRLIFRELKSQSGTVSAEQAEVGRKLRAAGQSWRIWRPVDLIDGSIGTELAVLAAIQGELWEAG
jgi:hypothetical protein